MFVLEKKIVLVQCSYVSCSSIPDSSSTSNGEEESETDDTPRLSLADHRLPNESQISNIFGVVLACLNRPQPGEAFQQCAVLYRHPGLAVLAACQQVMVLLHFFSFFSAQMVHYLENMQGPCQLLKLI